MPRLDRWVVTSSGENSLHYTIQEFARSDGNLFPPAKIIFPPAKMIFPPALPKLFSHLRFFRLFEMFVRNQKLLQDLLLSPEALDW